MKVRVTEDSVTLRQCGAEYGDIIDAAEIEVQSEYSFIAPRGDYKGLEFYIGRDQCELVASEKETTVA